MEHARTSPIRATYCITNHDLRAVRIGTLSQNPSQVLDNLKTALPAITQHIKDGWDNIQSLYIKTNSSVSLPIWTCRLDDSKEGRWDGLTAEIESDEGGATDEEAETDITLTSEAKQQEGDSSKRKKHVSEDHEGGEDRPKKKKSKKTEGGGLKQDGVSKQKQQRTGILPLWLTRSQPDWCIVEAVSDKKLPQPAAKKAKETFTFGGASLAPSVIKAELKQKRLKDASKKKKILGSKSGKRVKALVLGKMD